MQAQSHLVLLCFSVLWCFALIRLFYRLMDKRSLTALSADVNDMGDFLTPEQVRFFWNPNCGPILVTRPAKSLVIATLALIWMTPA